MTEPRKNMRLLAGIVAFVGFNALVALVQADLTPFRFWPSFWQDCAATLAFGVVNACAAYAGGLFH